MGEEIAFENVQISDCQGLVTLTLDRVILHTVMHHSLTYTYMYIPNFIEIEETFCGRTDGRTDRRTFILHTLLGRLGGFDLIIIIKTITKSMVGSPWIAIVSSYDKYRLSTGNHQFSDQANQLRL